MQAGASFRQRASQGLSTAQVRRLQEALWLIVLVLAIAINLRVAREQIRLQLELSDMTPADAAQFRAHLASLGITNTTLTILNGIGSVATWLAGMVLAGVLLVKRKGTDWFAFYISLAFLAGVGAVYPPDLRQLVDHQPIFVAIGVVLTSLSITSLFLLPMLFPNGRFVPRWMGLVAVGYLFLAISFIADPSRDVTRGLPVWVEAGTDLFLLVSILGSIVYRYRRHSTVVERQQMKWALVGLAIAIPAFFVADATMRNIDGSVQGVIAMLGFIFVAPAFSMVFPVCLTLAISALSAVRYRSHHQPHPGLVADDRAGDRRIRRHSSSVSARSSSHDQSTVLIADCDLA